MQGCPSFSIAVELCVISYRMLASRLGGCISAFPSVVHNSTEVTLNYQTMVFRQHGTTRTQLFLLVILFFTRGGFGGGCNEWTEFCLLLMNPKLMFQSLSVHLNAKEYILDYTEINIAKHNLFSL